MARYKLLQLSKPLVATMADSAPRFGFVAFAETWNGRMAMLGFVIGLATEVLTGQSILSQIGLG
jgi:ferrochelatase